MERLRIETGHLPKLEAQFIDYVLHCSDLEDDISETLNEEESVQAAIDIVALALEDEFDTIEEELRDEACDGTIDIEDALGIRLDGYIADCFEVTVSYTVEKIEDPNFERCAIRCIAAWAEQRMGGVDKMFALFTD